MQPDFDQLFNIASTQEGLFTAKQAAEVGYSSQLIRHHVLGGTFRKARRGVYRLVHFPFGDHEDLFEVWLWSDQTCVFSHDTALATYDVCDVLPERIQVTMPMLWSRRRVKPPEELIIHYAEVTESDRQLFSGVPITTLTRTLNDCAEANLEPDILGQAARTALDRGLVKKKDLKAVERALEPFGGIP